MADDEVRKTVTDAMRQLDEIYEQANRAISTLPACVAFAEASRLRDALERLRRRAARTRAELVQRIYIEEGISAAAIGRRLGLSKPRIEQLVNEAKGNR